VEGGTPEIEKSKDWNIEKKHVPKPNLFSREGVDSTIKGRGGTVLSSKGEVFSFCGEKRGKKENDQPKAMWGKGGGGL